MKPQAPFLTTSQCWFVCFLKFNKHFLQKFAMPAKTYEEYDDNDDAYSTWLPPSGQSGDGKTSLNAKFGY